MRTPDQIKNLRLVLPLIVGPVVYFWPDEMVDKWADALQRKNDSVKYEWDLKIRIKGNDTDWANIPIEPKRNIPMSLIAWREKAAEWFVKYPNLAAIRVNIKDSPEDVYIFTKEQQNG